MKVPVVLKFALAAFVAVLVPYYWRVYGPENFLYFCDVALFLALIAAVSEKSLPASMACIGVAAIQLLWCFDLVATGLGMPLLNMTAYMFDSNVPLATRALQSFHAWLPFVLVFLVFRLGYDRRGFAAWTLVSWLLIVVSYTLFPAPAPVAERVARTVNINYVYGLSDITAQTWMPQWAWLAVLFFGLPLVVFLPTHLILKRFCAAPAPAEPRAILLRDG